MKQNAGWPAARLQALRAIEVLEIIGNPAARELLVRRPSGYESAPLTHEAREALKRLDQGVGRRKHQ
ncbi:MAG TPA: hypothetical protein VFA18_10575 [Gemmataceae bacterium]|nr:hypothetical protein [Gemmataceae bacterium]